MKLHNVVILEKLLIKKKQRPEDKILYNVSVEETDDTVKRAHLATNHDGS